MNNYYIVTTHNIKIITPTLAEAKVINGTIDGPYEPKLLYSKQIQNSWISLGYLGEYPVIWEGYPNPDPSNRIKFAPDGTHFEHWINHHNTWWNDLSQYHITPEVFLWLPQI